MSVDAGGKSVGALQGSGADEAGSRGEGLSGRGFLLPAGVKGEVERNVPARVAPSAERGEDED